MVFEQFPLSCDKVCLYIRLSVCSSVFSTIVKNCDRSCVNPALKNMNSTSILVVLCKDEFKLGTVEKLLFMIIDNWQWHCSFLYSNN